MPMKIALRADANENQGAGHVMRCLTLAEAFIARGHSVTLLGNIGNVPWLWEVLKSSTVEHLECGPDLLEIDRILATWDEQAQSGRTLYYSCPGRQFVAISSSLIRDFGEPEKFGMYESMRSVRNVDPDIMLKPVGRA